MKFRGHSFRSLDPKGRLMLPPEFRETILEGSAEGKLIVTNFDDCIAGYPLPEWEQIEETFSRINVLNKQLRNFQRFFISGAVEVSLDKQGRILLPPELREYAALNREAVLAGVGRKFEIWDRERFEARRAEMDFDSVMDTLAESGFELRI
ncbi:MAG: division/cell wall cluster transcriptional repressor MraZ [Desulfovibrionales bacterium]